MRLILIRHGESHHTLRGVIGGPAGCTGLTERGVGQARALARRLTATGELADCAALLCSPWSRARQTAEILMEALVHSAAGALSSLTTAPSSAPGGQPGS